MANVGKRSSKNDDSSAKNQNVKNKKNLNVNKQKNSMKKENDNNKVIFSFFKNKDEKKNRVKKYNKKKQKKNRQKKYVNGKFSLDILDLLIVVVMTAIISCVFTGFILNHQYKKNFNFINSEVIDDGVKEFLETYSEIIDNFYEEVRSDFHYQLL